MDPSLGERIKRLREVKQWTLEQLADASGVDKGQISRYEKNTADPGTKSLAAVARALDVRAGFFFGEIQELEELTPHQVATRESLRRFLEDGSLFAESKRKRYRDVVDLPAAPLTMQGWKDLEELLRRLSGAK
jgi:transcriptional regulator with XRE-family HTH domain